MAIKTNQNLFLEIQVIYVPYYGQSLLNINSIIRFNGICSGSFTF